MGASGGRGRAVTLRDARRPFAGGLAALAFVAVLALTACTRKPKPRSDYSAKVNTVGIKVSHDANRTVWKIPFAETFEPDKKLLFDVVVKDFQRHIDSLNAKLDANNAASNPTTDVIAEKLTRSEELQSAIERILSAARSDKGLEAKFESALDPEYETRYGKVRQLSAIQSYVLPQAFMVAVEMRVSLRAGVGGGGAFMFLWAFQPYVTVTVDNKTGKTLAQDFEVDSEIFAVPSTELGCGIGAAGQPAVGVGAIFGPMKNPAELAGVGIKVAGNVTVPVIGGINGRVVLMVKFPPLYYVAATYGTGTGAEASCSGGIEIVLSVDEFLKRFAPPSAQNAPR